jgi:hypothetical protein
MTKIKMEEWAMAAAKEFKIKAKLLNQIIMGLIVFQVLFGIYLIYDRNLFSSAVRLSAKNIEELNAAVIDNALEKGRLGRPLRKDKSGEFWNPVFLEEKALFAMVGENEVKVCDVSSKRLYPYGKSEYIDHLNRSMPYLLFINTYRYDIASFADEVLRAEIASLDAPIFNGFVAFLGENDTLVLLSKEGPANTSCTWPKALELLNPSSLP